MQSRRRVAAIPDKKNPTYASMQESLLGSHAVDVTREHGAFLDVGDAEEASRDTLETDGEAAVRGHAVAEGVEVETESIRGHATTEHLLAVVGFFMDTLSAPLSGNHILSLAIRTCNKRIRAQKNCISYCCFILVEYSGLVIIVPLWLRTLTSTLPVSRSSQMS